MDGVTRCDRGQSFQPPTPFDGVHEEGVHGERYLGRHRKRFCLERSEKLIDRQRAGLQDSVIFNGGTLDLGVIPVPGLIDGIRVSVLSVAAGTDLSQADTMRPSAGSGALRSGVARGSSADLTGAANGQRRCTA